MSAPSSPGSEESSSAWSGPVASGPSGSASSTPGPAASSPATGPASQSTRTPRRSRSPRSSAQTSSAGASPVRTSAKPAPAPASRERARGSGSRTSKPFARFDPATSSWRTSQFSLSGALTSYSGDWPRAGTMRNGTVSPRAPLAPLTDATGYSSWPTPTTADAFTDKLRSSQQTEGSRHLVNLAQAVQMWPTPMASDALRGSRTYARGNPTLLGVVKLLPTPKASDGRRNGCRSEQERDSPDLPAIVGGRLNPTWVEWLMGFPLGWTDLEGSGTPSFPTSPSGSASESSKGSVS